MKIFSVSTSGSYRVANNDRCRRASASFSMANLPLWKVAEISTGLPHPGGDRVADVSRSQRCNVDGATPFEGDRTALAQDAVTLEQLKSEY